jgi:hypothetical protein
MTGKKATKCKCKKKTSPKVIGLYGVKITKGMNLEKVKRKEMYNKVNEQVNELRSGQVPSKFQRLMRFCSPHQREEFMRDLSRSDNMGKRYRRSDY